jgi:dynein heavy chain
MMSDVMVIMEVTKNALAHMHGVFEQIFMPLLHNEQNSRQWTELVSKDLIEKFNNYLAQTFVTMGQIHGQTQLPTPPHKLTQGDNISEKDKAHVFEGCVIMWTKQIKNILKLEPEQALKHGHPNPLVEIAFWKNKSENLDSIHQQL